MPWGLTRFQAGGPPRPCQEESPMRVPHPAFFEGEMGIFVWESTNSLYQTGPPGQNQPRVIHFTPTAAQRPSKFLSRSASDSTSASSARSAAAWLRWRISTGEAHL